MRISPYIDRFISSQLIENVKHFPAVVVTGARQTGKTTLIRHLFPDHHYVSLDRPLMADQAEQDPEAFLSDHPAPLIIDEIQYAPSLFRYLKINIDAQRQLKGQYILTGSQKFNLMQGVTESLAGRAYIIELETLSCLELFQTKAVTPNIESYHALLLRGGYPELWVDTQRSQQAFLDSYMTTYLERDVRQVIAINNLRDFERFLRACALRTGQQLNKTTIAREIGVSVTTISEWLNVLQALGQIVLLEPWFTNIKKRLVKTPKLYFTEPALVGALLGIEASQLNTSAMIGPLWETFVFAELRKQLTFSKGTAKNLWYYRDQTQQECDFIYQNGTALDLFECKWTSQPSIQDAKNLNKIQRIFEKNQSTFHIRKKVLISRADARFTQNDIEFRHCFNLL